MNYPYQTQPEQPPSSYRALDSGDYELVVRQQPKEALVAQPGKEKNRKPVDPPPIIELRVTSGADPARQFLQSPYLFMQCTLQVDQTSENAQAVAGQEITGQSVSSLHRLKDINNEDGGFFVFGDISIRLLGKHRLNFSLFELRKDSGEVVFLKSIVSDAFDVVQQKQWRGLEESTHLSRTFSDQGVRLRLRKENRNLAGSKRAYPYSPRSSTHAGPSAAAAEAQNPAMYGGQQPLGTPYGYEDTTKRHRSSDQGQPQGYPLTERGLAAYDPRPAPANMQPMYPVQPSPSIHSPHLSYGARTPVTNSGWPPQQQQQQPFTYQQGSSSAPAKVPDSNANAAQGMTPNAAYALHPASIESESGEHFARRGTDAYLPLSHQVSQTSPATPYQGAGEAMFLPTSAAMPGPSSYAEHESAAMARQHTHTQSVASPASSTRSGLNPVAPAYSMQQPQLPPQNYANMSDALPYAYPAFRQQPYPGPSALLQQSIGNPLAIRQPQPGEPYPQQQHLAPLAIRQQQSGEPYPQQQPHTYQDLGQGYQAPSGGTYPTTQAPNQSRY